MGMKATVSGEPTPSELGRLGQAALDVAVPVLKRHWDAGGSASMNPELDYLALKMGEAILAALKPAEAPQQRVHIMSDPHAEFCRLLDELSNAIKLTTGRSAETTIWPVAVPHHALKPAIVGTFAGMRIIAPHAATSLLRKKVP